MEAGMNFENTVGIVTGGGTGIGKETAIELCKAGMKVVIGNKKRGKS